MARGKKHTPEQIVSLLRPIEVAVANGKTTPAACREGGITEQTYYRWRKEYGGLQVERQSGEVTRSHQPLHPPACKSPLCLQSDKEQFDPSFELSNAVAAQLLGGRSVMRESSWQNPVSFRRCKRKRRYLSLMQAEVFAGRASARTGELILAHECPDCGKFHIGYANRAQLIVRGDRCAPACQQCGNQSLWQDGREQLPIPLT